MKIDVNLNHLKTKVDLKDMKLSFVPGRGAKRERWGYICIKDYFHHKIADVCVGELKDSNALAKEIVRRFNDCPEYIKDIQSNKKYHIDNFRVQSHGCLGGKYSGTFINLISKDSSMVISLYKQGSDCEVWDIRFFDQNKILTQSEREELVRFIEDCARSEERDIFLTIPSSLNLSIDFLKSMGYIAGEHMRNGECEMFRLIERKRNK